MDANRISDLIVFLHAW